MQERFNGNGRG